MSIAVTDGSFTLSGWCRHRKVSRAKFYKLKKEKKVPRLHYVGVAVRISKEADADWLATMEAEAAA